MAKNANMRVFYYLNFMHIKRDLLCRMVVGVEYRECSRNLIAVALMVFLHFGIYWVMPEWVVGLLWFMKNCFLASMEVAFFGLVSL